MNKRVVTDEAPSLTTLSLVSMRTGDMMRTMLCGLGVGLLVALVAYLMDKYVFGAVLCRPQAASDCAQAPTYAMVVAMVIGAIAGIAALVRLRIYRPLLVVLAAVATLWGVNTLVSGLTWYWALLVVMVLFGLAYGLYAWVSRLRSFVLALVVTVVLVVVIRFALSA